MLSKGGARLRRRKIVVTRKHKSPEGRLLLGKGAKGKGRTKEEKSLGWERP